jgi:hypothetical protein
MGSLKVLQNTLLSPDPQIPLALGEFGTFQDAVHGNNPKSTLGIGVDFRHVGKDYSVDLGFALRPRRHEIIQRSFRLFDNSVLLIETSYSSGGGRQNIRQIGSIPSSEFKPEELRFFHFVPRMGQLLENRRNIVSEIQDRLRAADAALSTHVKRIEGLQYLGPNREAPLRVYSFTGERPSILSSSGGGAMDILVADQFHRGAGKLKLARAVDTWLQQAKIADLVQISPIGDRHYEVKVRHPISGEMQNYADVGFGVSQIMPVLVAGYNLQPGSLFMVEQPEIHLHPRAQSELGDFLQDLYNRGVQTIIETHSEHLIVRLQRHVASGAILPEHVAVNYVYAAEGRKAATRLRLDQDGLFIDKWPQGFFDERLSEALALARAPLRRRGELE